VVLLIGSLVMMFKTNLLMTVTAIVASIIGFVFMGIIMGKSQKYFFMQQKHLGEINGYIEEIYSGHTVVKAYNGEAEAGRRFGEMNDNLRSSGFKAQCLSGLMMPLMTFIGNLGYVAVCIVGALMAVNGKISFGVINLDRQSNFWIGYKFNITQIPYILLIEGGKMYQFKEQFDEMKVVQFIDEEKNIEDALDIPEDVGLSKKISFFMAGLIRQTSDLFVKFGFNNNMSNYLACALLFIFLVAMIYLEHKLINGIRNLIDYFKNWKKNEVKNNNEDIKDDKKNEEGEIKDNQENKPKKE
jgi:ABC-type bacteriocin/lantibiotic exporter with double-glycine peptidase domain